MSKSIKAAVITATVLIIIGTIIFTGVLVMFKFDFSKLGTGKFETNTYDINESFENISIDVDISKIEFLKSDNEECKVVCYEQENLKHNVGVKSSTLTIDVKDSRKWYHNIGISLDSPKLTVYLPQDKYASLIIDNTTGFVKLPDAFTFDDIKIKGSTGAIECFASATNVIDINLTTGAVTLDSLTASKLSVNATTGIVSVNAINTDGDVSVKTTTGPIKITNLNCKNLNAKSTTGSIKLSNTIATEKFDIKCTTGSVHFDHSDASDIKVKTTTGGVKGTLLSDKIFFTKSSTGSINVPKSTTGGTCDLETTTGSIKIDIV